MGEHLQVFDSGYCCDTFGRIEGDSWLFSLQQRTSSVSTGNSNLIYSNRVCVFIENLERNSFIIVFDDLYRARLRAKRFRFDLRNKR